ncbi:MAG: sulfatase [Candidatus Eisenbacteria bacterium]|nr:sulfatase [Candidatus Eisenbacteria bacterium]
MLRYWIAPAALGVGACIGTAEGIAEIVRQEYLPLGLHRNALLVFSDRVLLCALIGLGAAAAVLTIAAFVKKTPLGRRVQTVSFGFAATAAVGFALCRGWTRNRYTLATIWRSRERLAGLELPGGLTSGRVWSENLRIVGASLLIGAALYLLLRLLHRWSQSPGVRIAARRGLIAVTVTGLLAMVLAAFGDRVLFRNRVPTGLNVILISLDTLRADFLGCYGCARATSPGVDRLARDCVLFENAYSQAPCTVPSHGSFLTSRYPSVNRASMEGRSMPAHRVLCAEIFREAGYRTCGIVDASFLSGRYGFDQGYDDFEGWGRRARNIVPKAIRWLEGRNGRPFFLFIHIYDIHSPYARDPRYQTMFEETPYHGSIQPDGKTLGAYCHSRMEGLDPPFEINDEDACHLRTLYAGGVRYVDDILVRLADHVRDSGIDSSTLLVLTADHGEEFMEHGNVLHAELYRTVTHVPLLFRLPGGERGGRRISTPVGLIDLLPTLLDLTGLESPAPMTGRSLAPILRGTGEVPFRPIFSEFDDNRQLAVYGREHHLVRRIREDRWELFHVPTDPMEAFDRSREEGAIADSLRQILLDWRARMEDEILAEGGEARGQFRLREDERERLRALGYVR